MIDALWFFSPTCKAHAFEIVEGTVEPLSLCGRVELETCQDEPIRDPSERKGWACMYCSAHESSEEFPSYPAYRPSA